MLDVIDKEEGEASHRRILWLQVMDSNRVEITTGRLTGNLGGGGRFFRFNRTDKGWELDKKRGGSWEA